MCHEEFFLEDGEGLIDVRGNGFDCGLVVGGDPVAFYWSDCEGSIGQYLVRSRDTADLSGRLRTLRNIASGGLNLSVSLASQILPLLRLFTSGRYRLTYTTALRDWGVIPFHAQFSYATDRDGFYPCGNQLITTRHSDTLDRERVKFFRKRLAAGDRPILFAARVADGYCSFVLDGHHKLQAYQELRIPPAVLFIVKEPPDPIALEDGLRLLGRAERYRKDYRRVKEQYGEIVTEADWLRCSVPGRMTSYVWNKASDRKRRLFVCACCRHAWRRIGKFGQQAVEVAERFADQLASEGELATAYRTAETVPGGDRNRGNAYFRSKVIDACRPTITNAPAFSQEQREIAVRLVRDCFGNPFRPPPIILPAWLTWNEGTVPRLAESIYQDRAFDRFPILADALEEAGCADKELLAHCRGLEPHIRGCWLLDALLNKS